MYHGTEFVGTVVQAGVSQDWISLDSCKCWCITRLDLWGQPYMLVYHKTGSVGTVVHTGVSQDWICRDGCAGWCITRLDL